MIDLAKNLSAIQQRMAEAATRVGREISEIKLLAVSKTKPVEMVQTAVDAGQLYFGENYVQAAAERFPQLTKKPPGFELHLIGPLQRNKVKRALELFTVIETVDRIKLVEEMSRQAERLGQVQRILLQVNISAEENKSGCKPEEVADLCRAAVSSPHMQVEGLMSIGRWYGPDATDTECRKEFRQMRELRDITSASVGIPLPELSMGMSGDFEVAIEEGATIVRVGSAIFGARV